ncbi:MAG: Ig-like domain-containing protein [Lachnospiraceae bacterium]|nr:Ig-like domain-containing protein [Lachnospiraceae bacterium]
MQRNFMKYKICSLILVYALFFSGLIFSGNTIAEGKAPAISLDKYELSLNTTLTKTAGIKLKTAKGVTVKKITYRSKNSKIATVTKKGKVTVRSAGDTEIVVKVKYMQKKKTYTNTLPCFVHVVETTKPTIEKDDGKKHDAGEEAAIQKFLVRLDGQGMCRLQWQGGHIIKFEFSGPVKGKIDFGAFPYLETLYCHGNSGITALNVTKNTALKTLSCTGMSLKKVDISKNTELVLLQLDDCQLTALDISPLMSLEFLHCEGNSLTSLDVSHNTSLKEIRCERNQITELDVSACRSLIYLYTDDIVKVTGYWWDETD